MDILPVPMLSDNYGWLLCNRDVGECAIVDPSEHMPVVHAAEREGLRLVASLITHHHWDHVGGFEGLATSHPDLAVHGNEAELERIPAITHGHNDADTFDLWDQHVVCLLVPGHTRGAMAFHMPQAKALFTGDTLFTAGCGRLFEGTPKQMRASLQKLAALPPDTLVYCGHEYTQKNLRFALEQEPDNEAIRERLEEVNAAREENQSTVPARLDVELATNPFLRAQSDDHFARLREARDQF